MPPLELSPFQRVRLGQSPAVLKSRTQPVQTATPGSVWQGQVLFGNKGFTPSTFKVLQTWADGSRQTMPLLQQALYPLNGQRVGIEQMTDITQRMADDTRLKDLPKTRDEELKLLQPLLVHEHLLGEPDRIAHLQSIYMAQGIEDKDVKNYILNRAYGHPDYMVRYYLFFAMGQYDAESKKNKCSVDLLNLANDLHPWVRQQLASHIVEQPDNEHREAVFQRLLADDNASVSGTAAAEAPTILKDKAEAQQILRQALNDPDKRPYARSGIQHLDDPGEMEAQIERCLQEDPESSVDFSGIKEKVAPVLWQKIVQTMAGCSGYTAASAIPLLEDEAEREALVMKMSAEKNMGVSWRLQQLPEEKKKHYLEILSADENPNRRMVAVALASQLKSKRLKASALKEFLHDPDEKVRSTALAYFTDDMASKTMDRTILGLLGDEHAEVRQSAASALRLLSDPARRLAEFIRLSHDKDTKLRDAAWGSLDKLEPPEVRRAFFEEALHDNSPQVRVTALTSSVWKDWDEEEAFRVIQSLLNDPSSQVQIQLPRASSATLSKGIARFLKSDYPKMLETALHEMDPDTPLSWQDVLPSWFILLKNGADATRLKDSLAGYREFVAHAQKNRAHFTQEGQKPLDEEKMAAWLANTSPYILSAITLLGPEAVKGKFDEKANKFLDYLHKAHSLSTDPVLGPELYKTFHVYSRSHRTWEANRLLDIMYGLCMLGKRDDAKAILDGIRQARKIDMPVVQDQFLKVIGRFSGLSAKALDRDDIRERLARWSDPYVYTIGSAFNLLDYYGEERQGDKKLLTDIIKADLQNEFPAFMSNPRKPWGAANRKTENLFRRNGLDYDAWLGYNQPMTVTHGDRQFDISLWDRDPSECLFIGSYAKTCMALDTRPTEMLDGILSTFAQYALIRDKDTGEKIGYLRMYWALPDNGDKTAKPQLIIDNVAYNDETTDPNAKDLLKYALSYAKKYGKAVNGGQEPDIAFSKYIHTVSKEHVEERPIRVVGACRKNTYYLFSVNQYQRVDFSKPVTASVVDGANL